MNVAQRYGQRPHANRHCLHIRETFHSHDAQRNVQPRGSARRLQRELALRFIFLLQFEILLLKVFEVGALVVLIGTRSVDYAIRRRGFD